jgi:transforming growth factor-beta-induced protein
MRRVYSFLALFVALMGLMVMPVMAQNSGTVVDVLVGDDEGRFTTLTGAVVAAGLADALASGGPFTVFAPTNEAFAAALASLGSDGAALASNPEALAQVLLYHVVPGRVTAATLSFGRSTQTTLLEGATLSVVGGRQGVTINDSVNVIQADLGASNGLIHVIDGVLIPPSIMEMLAGGAATEPAAPSGQAEVRPNIPAVLNNDPQQRFTTLISALNTADLTGALDTDGAFTLLAPTNAAFTASLDALGLTVAQVAADPALLSQILLYHVIPERTRLTNLFGGATLATVQGEEVTFAENAAGQLTANDSVVIRQGNIQAGNGVIHVLDGVLVPPTILAALTAPPAPEVVAPQARPNLVDVLAADEDGRFATLVTAIDAAGLRPLLNSSSLYTMFAPTDAAINASLEALGLTVGDLVSDSNTLQEILLYHVVPGRIRSTELFRGVTLRTMSGQDLVTAEDERGRLTAGGVLVGQSNIAAGNGFIHVLNDGILVPPSVAAALTPPPAEEAPAAQADTRPTVAGILAADRDGRFTTLLAAVEAAGLTGALSGEGDFTVLAPTNAAFDAAFAATGLTAAELLADTETLTAILTYHVLPVRTRTANLFGGAELETLNGESVRFSEAANGQLVINDGAAQVLDANKVGSNGVVHAINAVLLPSPVAEAIAANRGQIRVAHFSPDAGPVDIYINGELSALQGVTFGAVSDWIEVPARAYNIAIAPSGQYPIGVASYDVVPGSRVTIAAIGTVTRGTLNVQFIEEDYSPIPAGAARVTIFHAIERAGVIDVRFNGSTVVSRLGYPGSLGDNDGADIITVGGITYNIEVVVSGVGTVIAQTQFPLSGGNYYLLAVVGTPDNPRFVLRTVTP